MKESDEKEGKGVESALDKVMNLRKVLIIGRGHVTCGRRLWDIKKGKGESRMSRCDRRRAKEGEEK